MASTRPGLLLSATYNQSMGRLGGHVRNAVRSVWAQTVTLDGDLKDRFGEFADAALPVVEGGQRQAAMLSAAFIRSYAGVETGAALHTPALQFDRYTTEALRGVPTLDVYERGIITVRSALKDGVAVTDALDRGAARVAQTARTDIALAGRQAMVDSQTSKIVGWRRVTAPTCCAVCDAIDGEEYATDELFPVHSECGCTVEPRFADEGPQLQRAQPTVEDSPAETDAATTGDLEVTVHQHNELGPVIYPAGQHFAQI